MPKKKQSIYERPDALQAADTESVSLKDWHDDDKPREKLVKFGPSSLTDVELLAILLGTGIQGMNVLELSRTILRKYNNKVARLARASVDELCSIKGMGPAKAISIITALELGIRRMNEVPEINVLNLSTNIAAYIRPKVLDSTKEYFYAIYVNSQNVEIATELIGVGNSNAVLVDSKKIFSSALRYDATGIILVHNHPSGSRLPSPNDIQITNRMVQGAKVLDMRVIDHVIIAGMEHYSFLDEGRLH